MNQSSVSAHLASRFELRSDPETRLHGYPLVLARVLCLILCVLSASLFVMGTLSYIANHYMFCTGAAAACRSIGNVVVPPGQGAGLSREVVGIYIVVRNSIFALGYWLV